MQQARIGLSLSLIAEKLSGALAADYSGTPRRKWRLFAAAVALALAVTGAAAPPVSAAWRVVDGDTLDLAGERIRLFGIDAPEYGQSCGPVDRGAAATDALDDILSSGPVRCDPIELDQYGRTIALCRAGSLDVNKETVRRGMAWAFVRYANDYLVDEEAATESGIGIWKHPSQPAWEYRAEKWDRAAQEAPDGCAIKGNIPTQARFIIRRARLGTQRRASTPSTENGGSVPKMKR